MKVNKWRNPTKCLHLTSATGESYQTKMPDHALQKLWGKRWKKKSKSESRKGLWQRTGAGEGECWYKLSSTWKVRTENPHTAASRGNRQPVRLKPVTVARNLCHFSVLEILCRHSVILHLMKYHAMNSIGSGGVALLFWTSTLDDSVVAFKPGNTRTVLVYSPVEIHAHIFVLSKALTCFEMMPRSIIDHCPSTWQPMSSLQLLLGLASTVILWYESRRTIFTASNLRLPEPGGPRPRIYFPKQQGGPVLPTTYVSITIATNLSLRLVNGT
jgi:hypothetical protein